MSEELGLDDLFEISRKHLVQNYGGMEKVIAGLGIEDNALREYIQIRYRQNEEYIEEDKVEADGATRYAFGFLEGLLMARAVISENARSAEKSIEEIVGEKPWVWLSFADDDRSLGVVIVEAQEVDEAVEVASARGINPGGQVLGWKLEHSPPEELAYRILTAEEVDRFSLGTSVGQALDRYGREGLRNLSGLDVDYDEEG